MGEKPAYCLWCHKPTGEGVYICDKCAYPSLAFLPGVAETSDPSPENCYACVQGRHRCEIHDPPTNEGGRRKT